MSLVFRCATITEFLLPSVILKITIDPSKVTIDPSKVTVDPHLKGSLIRFPRLVQHTTSQISGIVRRHRLSIGTRMGQVHMQKKSCTIGRSGPQPARSRESGIGGIACEARANHLKCQKS